MDEEPIYDFQSLRDFLIRLGYEVEKAQGYKEITPEEISIDDIYSGKLDLTDEAICVIGNDGQRHQVFLYKRDYHLEEYGKPKFHICRCKTINEFIESGGFRDHYIRANSEPVPVKDLDNDMEEVEVDNLPLCRNCASKIRLYRQFYSSEFVDILKQARGEEEKTETIEVDIFGYTRDWDKISREYREKHNYTCERCGIRIDDLFDRQYIHCHHKDGDKTNNKESNLECLCIRCHSKVDQKHRANFTSGANRIMLDYFNNTYPD